MKSQILKFAMVMAIVIVAAIGCDKKVEVTKTETVKAVDKDSVKTAIQAMENAYAEQLVAKNAEGVVSYYADDATSFPNEEAPLVGRAAIKASIEKQIKEAPKGATVAFTTNEVHISGDGNQVVEVGSYKVSDSTGTKLFSGNFIGMFENRDGKYVCVRDMAVADHPKPKK
jgi:uncharacterized protein (TIGR02246 family)